LKKYIIIEKDILDKMAIVDKLVKKYGRVVEDSNPYLMQILATYDNEEWKDVYNRRMEGKFGHKKTRPK